jgi:Zn-dependent protease
MYVPSEPEDDLAHGSRAPMPWPGLSPTPIRWAGPDAPSGAGPTARANSPYPPYPPYPSAPLPIRSSAPAPSPSGALLSIGSFVVSVALYDALLGLRYGFGRTALLLSLGITVLLLVHELGHYIVIRAKGLPVALPVFIPFIGAYVAMRRMPQTVRDDAIIALAGPLAGCFSALGCLALYQVTGDRLFLSLAFLAYALNLLNLVPILPLDGGRVANAITPLLGPLAFALVVWYALSSANYLLLALILFFCLPAIVRSLAAGRRSPFFRITLVARFFIAVVYLLVTATLLVGLLATPTGFAFRL